MGDVSGSGTVGGAGAGKVEEKKKPSTSSSLIKKKAFAYEKKEHQVCHFVKGWNG